MNPSQKHLNIVGVTEAVQAGTAIAQTIAQISDMNKRRRFEESLATLTNQQTKELNEKLLRTNSQTERLSILSGSIVDYAIANDTAVSREKTVLYVIAASLGGVMMILAIIYAIKKKK